ncbi:hypothetical protein [Apilactobacillus bombintestini]|uniref:Biofilm polysaccharide intercellular adhesin synthesis protein IcaD n=1 Tax=Apilactobacillus bombintestini TaxID=2419772 RepID=A0A387AUF8_9LACO|nr:hypothetical protein [Apilactobacillus bombintestini]AYF92969.1 hypothetical protein D7I45_05620 [Apilactobacillus bombintestini]
MKKRNLDDYDLFVIRKKSTFLRKLMHFVLFSLLWIYVIFVLVTNLAFLLGYYSDDFVSFYLLLNLNYILYIKIIVAIIILIVLTSIYSIFRLKQLRRLNKHVDQK